MLCVRPRTSHCVRPPVDVCLPTTLRKEHDDCAGQYAGARDTDDTCVDKANTWGRKNRPQMPPGVPQTACPREGIERRRCCCAGADDKRRPAPGKPGIGHLSASTHPEKQHRVGQLEKHAHTHKHRHTHEHEHKHAPLPKSEHENEKCNRPDRTGDREPQTCAYYPRHTNGSAKDISPPTVASRWPRALSLPPAPS